MASTVDVCNLALTKLGAARITDLLDDTRNARVMNALFEAKRDAEMAAHPWTFAMTRDSVPAISAAPAFGWARSFPLPTNCLRLVEVGELYVLYDTDQGALFQVEGGAILTDEGSPLRIRYVQRIFNTGLFPPLFVELLASRLAAEAAEEVTQNLSKREAAERDYMRALREARKANAIEQPPQRAPDLSWVREMTRG